MDTLVTMALARHDLFTNPTNPLLFRKWLRLLMEDAPADIRECKSLRRQEGIEAYCGSKVIELLGCKCANNSSYNIDPEQDYQYSSGQFNIRGRKGPCSVWSGHIGYCWEGTMASEPGRPPPDNNWAIVTTFKVVPDPENQAKVTK